MSRKRLTDWKMLCAFLLVVSIGLAVVVFRAGGAPYHFLDGRKPFESTIQEWYGTFREEQYYSWNGEFTAVSNEMLEELKPLGFEEVDYPSGKMYEHPDYTAIMLKGRKASTVGEAFMGKGEEGVTIIILRELPSNWLTRFRKWLQR